MGNNLIIPFVSEAYVTNGKNVNSLCPPRWAVDYSLAKSCCLGSECTPEYFSVYPHALKAGIHLHFVLPEAFRHGSVSEDGKYDFPAVPDMYITTRMYEHEGKIYVKSFITDSAFISVPDGSEDASRPAVPRLEDGASPYRLIGRAYDPLNPPKEDGERLDKLTALGGGDPLFAAYYPSCSTVFGLHDDLSGVPDNVKISYFTAGYFRDPKNDPLYGIDSEEKYGEFLSSMNFTLKDGGEGIPNRTVLFGEALDIEWSGAGDDKYYKDMYPVPGTVDVSFAVSSEEALSAVLAQKALKKDGETDDDKKAMEDYLTELQYDLLKVRNTEDGGFKSEDEIFRRGFRAADPMECVDKLCFSEDDPPKEPPDLSEYHKLRSLQREAGRLERELGFEKKKLYCAWENYIKKTESPYGSDEEEAEVKRLLDELEGENGLESGCAAARAKVREQREKTIASLPKGCELKTVSAEPFFIPKDPAVMVSGEGINRSCLTDGGDNPLLCARAAQYSDEIDARKALGFCEGEIPDSFSDFPFDYNALFYQALLNMRPSVFGEYEIKGEISPLAVNRDPLEWRQTFMEWRVKCRLPDGNASLDGWKMEYGDVSYSENGAALKERTVSGRIPLTPHAVRLLTERLEEYGLTDVKDKLRDLPFISQQLSGFISAMSGLEQSFQFPVEFEGSELSKKVAKHAEGDRLSVNGDGLFPIWGGELSLDRLTVVSSFGQKREIVGEGGIYEQGDEAFIPNDRRVEEKKSAAFPAALTSAARLSAEFVPVDETGRDGSPIYAIILPEPLNKRLKIYDARGNYAGTVKVIYRDGESGGIYVPPTKDDFSLSFAAENFINGLCGKGNALEELLRLLEITLDKCLRSRETSFVWGAPMVLARLRTRFEFFGGAEYDKSPAEYRKYCDKGAGKLKIPLKFGNVQRVSDGLAGVYLEDDMTKIYPMWGADREESRVAPDSPAVCADDGDRYFAALMCPKSAINIETGLLPDVRAEIEPLYVSAADKIKPAAEIYPVLAEEGGVRLPLGDGFEWEYQKGEEIISTAVKSPKSCFSHCSLIDGAAIKIETSKK